MTDRRQLGRWGEDRAAAFLEEQGYQVVARNWRCPGLGEIDLVAQHESCLIFVEVRVRTGRSYGTPEESVTRSKRARLIRLAEAYVLSVGWQSDWRIDVIALELDSGGRLVRRKHIPNAVTGWDDVSAV
jgi:putative endonuclease